MSHNLHQAIYAVLAVAHAGPFFGLHEAFVPLMLAICYAVLALSKP